MNSLNSKIKRPKISIFIACSLDGFIAKEDGSLDFLSLEGVEGEDCGFKEFMDSIDSIIMGKNTYEVVSKFEECHTMENGSLCSEHSILC